MPEDLTPEILLVRNVALEKEIDSLRTMLNNVAEQRDGFRAHVETLSVEALRLKEESDAARRQSAGLENQRAEMEREHTTMRARWSAELEHATRQFEELKDQMIPPGDLEAMRIKLIDETEGPWRERCRVLELELEKARGTAAALKREAEQHQKSLDAATHEHRAHARELEVKHEVALAEARARADAAQTRPPTEPTDMERMRRMQKENTEVKVRQEKLLEEIEDLRSENEGLCQVREQLLQAQAQGVAEQKAAAKLMATERDSQQRRSAHLQQELDAANSAHARLHEGYLRQENEARKLRAALDDAQLGGVDGADGAGDALLARAVDEAGANFSQGERQLLSLARAVLRRRAVVAIDEATSSVDGATDALVQRVLRTAPAFRDATTLVIAHRLDTIADSDCIAVFSAGELVECDAPAALLEREGGAYARMWADASGKRANGE